MKKKIVCLILVCFLAMPVLGACNTKKPQDLSNYKINASLSAQKVLTVDMELDYFNNTETELNQLMLHLYANAFRKGARFSPVSQDQQNIAYPYGKSYSELNITKVAVNGVEQDVLIEGQDEDILVVNFEQALKPTQRKSIQISYSLKLPIMKHRLGTFNQTVNLGNFYPIACVYENGEFITDPYYSNGDPFYSECANYDVTFTIPNNYKGAFTGKIYNESSEDENTIYKIRAGSVRDFAAVLGEFSVLTGNAGSTIVNYYYVEDNNPQDALKAAIDSIMTFSELFGAYPYEEYDVVKTAFSHGGMEYPGLVYISDAYSGDAFKEIIVHETAHQWWYSAVGNNQVSHAWLDEGLCEFSTMLFYKHNPDYNVTFDDKLADALSAYMLYCELYKENGKGDTSMNRALGDYLTSNEYKYLTYVKGALMFESVTNYIGEAALLKGLKNYYQTYKNKIATPDCLIGALENASKKPLKSLMDSFIDGKVLMYGN